VGKFKVALKEKKGSGLLGGGLGNMNITQRKIENQRRRDGVGKREGGGDGGKLACNQGGTKGPGC